MIGLVRLYQRMPRLLRAPCPPCNLYQCLISPLARARVPARKTKVAVDHANKCEVRKIVSLHHHLRPNENINLAAFHTGHARGNLGGIACCVRAKNFNLSALEMTRRFFGHPLHTRPN